VLSSNIFVASIDEIKKIKKTVSDVKVFNFILCLLVGFLERPVTFSRVVL